MNKKDRTHSEDVNKKYEIVDKIKGNNFTGGDFESSPPAKTEIRKRTKLKLKIDFELSNSVSSDDK